MKKESDTFSLKNILLMFLIGGPLGWFAISMMEADIQRIERNYPNGIKCEKVENGWIYRTYGGLLQDSHIIFVPGEKLNAKQLKKIFK